ncbi:methyltransferase domain-containing protein [Flagellimonas olearia]|uniref:Methyltransferase domain-containing protein n=1 Tax=Flagellimonas olearia TaxID=552546 RepID=A0A6I1DXW2_9FLAO|nr:class I SAM-dependent methyltransferase [Allomuricauda olearia]KAB7530406.1 methyltransferase domain-containing protein [Allomuricauda olearia]
MGVKYDKLGINYNVTRKADPFLVQTFLKYLRPKLKGIYLDIGCGTGNYTNEFQKEGYRFIGVDPSLEMLEKARLKNKNIGWKKGSAEKLELANNSVDGIIGCLTVHHWTNINKAFHELYRVLKTDGRIVIFTSTPKQMKGYWLNHYFPRMLDDAITQMPSLSHMENAIKKCGLEIVETEKYFILPNLQDKFLYSGKHNPEYYFDEQIRNGISSFSSLENQMEVKIGLSKLKADIDNGEVHKIMESYKNNKGDYLFIVGRKSVGNRSNQQVQIIQK